MNAMQDLPSIAMSSNQNESGGGGGAGPPLPTAFKSPSTDGKSGSRRSTRFKDEDEYVEVTLDVRDGGGGGDDVAVLAIKDDVRDDTQDAASLLDRPAPGGAGGGLSSKLRAARARLGRIASGKRAAVPLSALLRRDPDRARLDRSVVTALRGLQFLNQAAVTEGWPEVEKRFHRLAVDGFLLRSRFGQCIGESPSTTLLSCISLSLSTASLNHLLQGWSDPRSLRRRSSTPWHGEGGSRQWCSPRIRSGSSGSSSLIQDSMPSFRPSLTCMS
jgi:hypothetical protein